MDLYELQDKTITSYHIGFVLGPCLNAAGRIQTAKLAFELLRAEDERKALQIARQLQELNERRKKMTNEGVIRAKEDADAFWAHPVLVIYLPECHESVAGIIAGRIRDYAYKPTIILTDGEKGIKGSGRSIEGYNMFEELTKCKHLLTKFGGHAMAAGLSLEEENVDVLRTALNRNCRLSTEDLVQKIWIDVAMPFEYASKDLVEQLDVLEPFGKGNERPVFAEKNIAVLGIRIFGEQKNVIRLKVANGSGCIMNGVYFADSEAVLAQLTEEFGSQEVDKALNGIPNKIRLSIIYYPRIHTYRGYTDVEIQIERIKTK
jgi:single-stranded-DNA-specific exonuclease